MQTAFEVSQDWGHGFVGYIHLQNQDTKILDDWVLTFETTFDIETLWGGEIIEHQNHRYTVRAKGWNSCVGPGEQTKVGFVGRNAKVADHQITVIAQPVYFEPVADSPVFADAHTPSAAGAVEFEIANDWPDGFTANLSFTYSGEEPLDSWKLQFESQFEIVELWHGEIVEHRIENSVNVYTVGNASWNGLLLTGDTFTIGLNGKGSWADQPSNYVFNDWSVVTTLEESVILDIPQQPETFDLDTPVVENTHISTENRAEPRSSTEVSVTAEKQSTGQDLLSEASEILNQALAGVEGCQQLPIQQLRTKLSLDDLLVELRQVKSENISVEQLLTQKALFKPSLDKLLEDLHQVRAADGPVASLMSEQIATKFSLDKLLDDLRQVTLEKMSTEQVATQQGSKKLSPEELLDDLRQIATEKTPDPRVLDRLALIEPPLEIVSNAQHLTEEMPRTQPLS
ncbi:MAG: cellulose binding domain-containing protein [Cyanobacteria bacterium P01_D01_bin.156]